MRNSVASKISQGIFALGAACALVAGFGVAPAVAQSMERIDPDLVIDGDLAGEPVSPPATAPATPAPPVDVATAPVVDPSLDPDYDPAAVPVEAEAAPTTFARDDLIGAAEGLFGEGAEGLARMIEDILEEQGEPIGYIVGREAGGAVVLGVRYGSGTLYHRVEGNIPVYWTGPSIGFDFGANASNTFVLVYNLYDSEELFERFPAGEGTAYLVGGFTASYLRRGDIVLIPIRVGAGLRLGVNAGYMRFSREQRWSPF